MSVLWQLQMFPVWFGLGHVLAEAGLAVVLLIIRARQR